MYLWRSLDTAALVEAIRVFAGRRSPRAGDDRRDETAAPDRAPVAPRRQPVAE